MGRGSLLLRSAIKEVFISFFLKRIEVI